MANKWRKNVEYNNLLNFRTMSNIRALKEQVDQIARIEEVVRDVADLKPAGNGRLVGLCPFHDERTPSFSVNTVRGRFRCFGSCGVAGSVYDFVMKHRQVDFKDAVLILAGRYGIVDDGSVPVQVKDRLKSQARPQVAVDRIPWENYLPHTDEGLWPENTYFKFMVNHYGEQAARDHFREKKLGTSKLFRIQEGYAVMFPYISISGELTQVKTILCNPATGKRIRKIHSYETWNWKTRAYAPAGSAAVEDKYVQDAARFTGLYLLDKVVRKRGHNLRACFYNEQSLSKRPALEALIVEAEKSADTVEMYDNNRRFVCLALGGANGCRWTTKEVASVLKGRKVKLGADLSPGNVQYHSWEKELPVLRGYGITVVMSDTLENLATEQDRADKLDIADLLLRTKYSSFVSPVEPSHPSIESRPIQPDSDINFPASIAKEIEPRFELIWTELIDELEAFFRTNPVNVAESFYNGCERITGRENIEKAIKADLGKMKTHNGNPTFSACIDRLNHFRSIIANANQ